MLSVCKVPVCTVEWSWWINNSLLTCISSLLVSELQPASYMRRNGRKHELKDCLVMKHGPQRLPESHGGSTLDLRDQMDSVQPRNVDVNIWNAIFLKTKQRSPPSASPQTWRRPRTGFRPRAPLRRTPQTSHRPSCCERCSRAAPRSERTWSSSSPRGGPWRVQPSQGALTADRRHHRD